MMKIARIALALGLLTSVSSPVFAAGLVTNDNELRNDLSWLSDRGVIQLSLSTVATEPGRDYPRIEEGQALLFVRAGCPGAH